MKRLALLLVAVALLWPAAANAQLTMQMSNGWTFSFAGNVNVFWVFTKGDSLVGDASNSSVRTGLLPAFATFSAKGKEAGMDLGVHFGFAPQVNNGALVGSPANSGAVHDQFGAQIDMRQVYLTVGGRWGQILAGRELGLFGRQNIINDMTLFGVGAIGIGGAGGGGTTLGRIGYGYIYPNFNAQVTYSSRSGRPGQLSIGLFQPSALGFGTGATDYVFTRIPRVEAEFTYNQKSGKNTYVFWVGGLWQSTADSASGGNTLSSFGGTAGVKAGVSDLSIVVTGYIGSGLGTTLLFSGDEVGTADPTKGHRSDGGYVQLTYKFGPKTTVGGSWGFSRLKHTTSADGDEDVTSNLYSYTAGVYHQWTKSLKFVVEGTMEGTTGETEGLFAGLDPGASQINISGGFMLFY